ncbi:MAG TPA: DUF2059 domain-containing protein [Myxococcales bacterium]|nr:DUF2059 domain-containing protein [Myxococcales bacterium]
MILIALLLAAAPAPTAEARALAKAITPVQRYQGMLEQLYRPLLASAQQRERDSARLEQIARQVRDAAAKALPYDDLLEWTAQVYGAHFSAGELKQLLKFYESPLGRKYLDLQPQVNNELFANVLQVFPQRFEAAMKDAQPPKP